MKENKTLFINVLFKPDNMILTKLGFKDKNGNIFDVAVTWSCLVNSFMPDRAFSIGIFICSKTKNQKCYGNSSS